jgi:hypothetical protein
VVCGNITGELSEAMNVIPAIDVYSNQGKYSVVYISFYMMILYYYNIIQAM